MPGLSPISAVRVSRPPSRPTARRFRSELLADNGTAPMKMELMVANADGSNARAITNFGCASFAPTFTPDGKKIQIGIAGGQWDRAHEDGTDGGQRRR